MTGPKSMSLVSLCCCVQLLSRSVACIEEKPIAQRILLRHLPPLRHGNEGVSIDEGRNKVVDIVSGLVCEHYWALSRL